MDRFEFPSPCLEHSTHESPLSILVRAVQHARAHEQFGGPEAGTLYPGICLLPLVSQQLGNAAPTAGNHDDVTAPVVLYLCGRRWKIRQKGNQDQG